VTGAGLGERNCGHRELGQADGNHRHNGCHCQQRAQGTGVFPAMSNGMAVVRQHFVGHCGTHECQQQDADNL
jgi:hypothetical protein